MPEVVFHLMYAYLPKGNTKQPNITLTLASNIFWEAIKCWYSVVFLHPMSTEGTEKRSKRRNQITNTHALLTKVLDTIRKIHVALSLHFHPSHGVLFLFGICYLAGSLFRCRWFANREGVTSSCWREISRVWPQKRNLIKLPCNKRFSVPIFSGECSSYQCYVVKDANVWRIHWPKQVFISFQSKQREWKKCNDKRIVCVVCIAKGLYCHTIKSIANI